MTKTKIIAENKNYKAIDIGSFDQLSKHEFIHPKFKNIDKGRLFIGELLQTTGAEISFRELPSNTKIPFLHKHHKHEEIYIFLKGSGQFQVDDEVFKIKEGSIVRVSMEGNRTLSNDSKEPMIYMVVQSQADTLAGYDVSDGYRV
ncbi:MAG: cupin domain-containing protein [Bacteroidota bacterium]